MENSQELLSLLYEDFCETFLQGLGIGKAKFVLKKRLIEHGILCIPLCSKATRKLQVKSWSPAHKHSGDTDFLSVWSFSYFHLAPAALSPCCFFIFYSLFLNCIISPNIYFSCTENICKWISGGHGGVQSETSMIQSDRGPLGSLHCCWQQCTWPPVRGGFLTHRLSAYRGSQRLNSLIPMESHGGNDSYNFLRGLVIQSSSTKNRGSSRSCSPITRHGQRFGKIWGGQSRSDLFLFLVLR